MTDDRAFFDQQTADNRYSQTKEQCRGQDEAGSHILNAEVSGDVLVVGGVWDWFEWKPALKTLTILDVSSGMLQAYSPPGAVPILGDFFELEFAEGSFDAIVFPLMLHHTAERSWGYSALRIRQALERARRWLRPGGRVLIFEHCPHRAWSPIQRLLFPVTKQFMEMIGQEVVLMNTREAYEDHLRAVFGACQTVAVRAHGLKPWSLLPVFLGAPWIKLPFAVYPKAHVFLAAR